MKMKSECIGTMTLGNTVDITDPSYDKRVSCRMTTECVPGEYVGHIIVYNRHDEWGERVSSIIISKDDKANEIGVDSMKKIGSIGVDVGLAGFFNNKPDFTENKWYDFLRESGVRGKDGRNDYSKRCYDCEYGLFSESGYGDGVYDVYAFPEKDGFMISFI